MIIRSFQGQTVTAQTAGLPDPIETLIRPEIGDFSEVTTCDPRARTTGTPIPGPAVIVEDETSTVVNRLFDARIDAFGYIELTRR
jgi:N-methylhydantoinase A